MAERIPRTPPGKEMKITVIEQGMPRKELPERLGITNSTVSDIIYGRDQRERTRERIARAFGIK